MMVRLFRRPGATVLPVIVCAEKRGSDYSGVPRKSNPCKGGTAGRRRRVCASISVCRRTTGLSGNMVSLRR